MKCFILFIVLFFAACADDLSKDAVTSIDTGNALGRQLSGKYEIDIRTTGCDGKCVEAGIGFCDVGQTDRETIELVQDDGALQIEWEEPVSLLEGGVNKNGAFEVGGFGTQLGGEREFTIRATGDVIVEKSISGSAESMMLGEELDCIGSYEFDGTFKSREEEDGESCRFDSECVTQCNRGTSTCGVDAPDGTACTDHEDCLGRCESRVCTS